MGQGRYCIVTPTPGSRESSKAFFSCAGRMLTSKGRGVRWRFETTTSTDRTDRRPGRVLAPKLGQGNQPEPKQS